jgi:hypothetical protein
MSNLHPKGFSYNSLVELFTAEVVTMCRQARGWVDAASIVPGRRLDGPNAYLVRLPPSFRHKVLKTQQNSAVARSASLPHPLNQVPEPVLTWWSPCRQWESTLVHRVGVLDGRLFLSCGRSYPLAVSSVIKYTPGVEADRRLK